MARPPKHAADWQSVPAAQRQAWLRMLFVQRSVLRHLDAALEPHGLTIAEWDALVHLPSGGEGLRMGDLAARTLLSPSGLTRMVQRLEAARLVERRPGPVDAREQRVSLTREGLALLAAASPSHLQALQAGLFDHLRDGEWETFNALLGKLAAAHAREGQDPGAAAGGVWDSRE